MQPLRGQPQRGVVRAQAQAAERRGVAERALQRMEALDGDVVVAVGEAGDLRAAVAGEGAAEGIVGVVRRIIAGVEQPLETGGGDLVLDVDVDVVARQREPGREPRLEHAAHRPALADLVLQVGIAPQHALARGIYDVRDEVRRHPGGGAIGRAGGRDRALVDVAVVARIVGEFEGGTHRREQFGHRRCAEGAGDVAAEGEPVHRGIAAAGGVGPEAAGEAVPGVAGGAVEIERVDQRHVHLGRDDRQRQLGEPFIGMVAAGDRHDRGRLAVRGIAAIGLEGAAVERARIELLLLAAMLVAERELDVAAGQMEDAALHVRHQIELGVDLAALGRGGDVGEGRGAGIVEAEHVERGAGAAGGGEGGIGVAGRAHDVAAGIAHRV